MTFSCRFSGRGPLTGESASAVKPDLVAPGVNVSTISVGGGVAEFSGTSFVTPFVTGGSTQWSGEFMREAGQLSVWGEGQGLSEEEAEPFPVKNIK